MNGAGNHAERESLLADGGDNANGRDVSDSYEDIPIPPKDR